MKRHVIISSALCCFALSALADTGLTTTASEPDSTLTLGEVSVTRKRSGLTRLKGTAFNSEIISAGELTRAACCNLGESFTTNPSVDVNYNDAATGARQIKLLGLSGTYVQMLSENIPGFRGASMPYGLGYVAGPWIQSISVSKGASSVKHGYESITGQINIEMKKPQADTEVAANGYADIMGKAEVNANANLHINKRLSTALLLHGENAFKGHDANGDGFIDRARVRQVAAFNRWAYMSTHYVFQAGLKYLNEKRTGGEHKHHTESGRPPYSIGVSTNLWEFFTKNAYIYNRRSDGNVALIAAGSHNSQNSTFGNRIYNVDHTNLYASLMWEQKFTDTHSLSAGANINHDGLRQHYNLALSPADKLTGDKDTETSAGLYAQYSLNIDRRFLLMAGVRYDRSTALGHLFTPRFHLRWNPTDAFTFHASAGRGFRNPHPLAENSYLLASSRQIVIASDLAGEEAWNYGAGTSLTLHIANKPLLLSAEYYYTDFRRQLLIDFDTDPTAVIFKNLDGRSFSHTLQIEATYPFITDMNITAAWRFNNVRTDYGRRTQRKPLTPRYKGLLSVGYSPMMGLWQFDVTCSFTGSQTRPAFMAAEGDPAATDAPHPFTTLNAQVTRNFRHWAVYLGGENLTGYHQRYPIAGASNPWGPAFDTSLAWGPQHGAIIYIGFRYTYNKYR